MFNSREMRSMTLEDVKKLAKEWEMAVAATSKEKIRAAIRHWQEYQNDTT